jgi:hypothetical protein
LDLQCDDVVLGLADLIGVDGPNAQVFSDNSKIFSLASAILNLQLDLIVSQLARYSTPKHDLFKLFSITFYPLQKKVSPR